ncbi:SPOR domain-containing protein [Vibrio sp. SM6]|uniref:SPOR domain-containing protein n=1 Tax=Vibrio agarilyticus TaxID=2726741 RepID=A0A7X8TR91_9VIBR|nr:SPOR domain-containing protein [Vibrio agarilyticus]NLS13383.1 SPOR domain-containing protein [Vibrio agarilyticus]
MKKTAIISFTLLLGACSSAQYTTDVSSQSFREEFEAAPVVEPLIVDDVVEQNVVVTATPAVVVEQVEVKETNVVQLTPATNETVVDLTPPTTAQQEQVQRFGYTIQVVALGNAAKVAPFATRLPRTAQPVWSNYKEVNGTKWYTILYGDYATTTEAKKAIATLPADIRALKPFVKSLDAIKNSPYPTLDKLQ